MMIVLSYNTKYDKKIVIKMADIFLDLTELIKYCVQIYSLYAKPIIFVRGIP